MRPVPLPAGSLEGRRAARSVVFRPPEGISDEECGTVEAMIEVLDDDHPAPYVVRVAIAVDPGDVDRMVAGEPIWLTVLPVNRPYLPAFSVGFLPEPDEESEDPLCR